MAVNVNIALPNFAGGELSPKMRGRYELPIFQSGAQRMQNFLAETTGPARFRNGFDYVHHTRRSNVAALIDFQFNDEQAYVLEFTDGYMRVYKDEGVVLEAPKVITGITAANPPVVTSVAHGYVTGNEIFIFDVVGMEEVNGKSFLVTRINNDTFSLKDQDNVAVNGTGFTAYASGGTANRIFELVTPYREVDDLFKLKYAQNADTVYITHPYYEPRKLTRTGHAAWTIALYTRTADPFLDKKVITGISQANPANVTSVAHGLSTGNIVIIEGVVGMTEVNGRYYTITKTGADNFTLDGVDSSAYGAWSSAGYASLRSLLPAAVTFYESRLFYGGPGSRFWGSRAPDNNGVSRYEDHTLGANADDALANTIGSRRKVTNIVWMSGTDKMLAVGTFGGEFKVTGSPEDAAISASSISVKPVSSAGSENMAPAERENTIIYVQRAKRTVRSFEFDVLSDGFVSTDRNLVADHITSGLVKQIAFQGGRPDILWAVCENGAIIGLTFKAKEDVSGWHRHYTNLGADHFESLAVIPRPAAFDQLWVVVKRTVNGHVRRYVEFMNDPVEVPEFIDYFTDATTKTADEVRFALDMFEAQKRYIHVDSARSYDGLDRGLAAGASVTPAAATGTGVLFNAGANVFKASDVGKQIWKKAVDGVGEGRAEITAFNAANQVTVNILKDFNSTAAMAAGAWYLTTSSVTLLEHLEGRTVRVVVDGAVHPDRTVTSGAISLDAQASVVHVGMKYAGILKTMNLEAGGITGPSQTKKKNIHGFGIRFLNTLGCKYGTDLYKMQTIEFRTAADFTNRPPKLFSGDKIVTYGDISSEEKAVIIQQDQPLPCIVELIVPYLTTSNP